MPLPESISQDDRLRRIWRIIAPSEWAAERGANTENRQGTIRHLQPLNLLRLSAARDVERQEAIETNIFKSLALFVIGEIEILRHIDFRDVDGGGLIPDADQPVRRLVRKRFKQDTFYDAANERHHEVS